MKRILCAVIGAALLLGVLAAPAAAAPVSQSYNIIVPRFGGSTNSSYKTVAAGKHFGTYHRYSGGKSLYFQPMYSGTSAAGPAILISPGGPSAPWTRIWYNGTGSTKSILIKVRTTSLTAVDVLAQGTWYWNL